MALIPTTQKRPFIPAPGVMQAEMVYSYLAQKCENVYHFLQGDGATPPTVAQMQAVAAALENWESTQGRQMRHSAAVLLNITVRDLSTQSGPAIIRLPTTNVTGVGIGTAPPGNVTAAIKWNTGFRGRSFRGRTYHVGMPPNYITGNQLTAAAITDFLARYTALQTQLEAVAGIQMVVVSFAFNKFWRATALASHVINPSVDANLDSQRRRLAGRGQ